MDDLKSSQGPGHVPTWMMGFKSSTSTTFRKASYAKPWPAQRILWSALGDQKRHHPGLAAPPPLLGETSETGLCPGACPPSPTLLSFMLVGEGIMLAISLVLHSLNKLYAPERCITLCFAFSLVREVCSHVVLGVNDLRISTIIPKSNAALQGGHAERVLSPCTDIT